MSFATLSVLIQRELQDAFRNRWFIAYSAAFVVLCVALALMIVQSAGYSGVSGFGRTAAGLINLVLFLAPLMGFTLGAQALSTEREQGTMAYLMAQPISFAELFFAKFIGIGIAICGAIAIGFGLSSITISYLSGGQGGNVFLRLIGLTLLLALTSLAFGFLISSFSSRTATALGIAVVAWLLLVLIGDLGLMGTAVVLELSPEVLLGLTLINPLESYRIGAINLIRDSVELLGPAGLVARKYFGNNLTLIMTLIMVAWLILTILAAYVIARRKEQQ